MAELQKYQFQLVQPYEWVRSYPGNTQVTVKYDPLSETYTIIAKMESKKKYQSKEVQSRSKIYESEEVTGLTQEEVDKIIPMLDSNYT